jgi:hypothetical protein
MADEQRNVKLTVWVKCLGFMQDHPPTGWWLAGLGTLNVVLNLLELLK